MFHETVMSTPPGMKCGYDFNVVDTQQFPVLPAKKNVINLTNILQVEDSLGLTIQEKKKDVKKEEIKETKQKPVAKVVNIDTEEQEEVIPVVSFLLLMLKSYLFRNSNFKPLFMCVGGGEHVLMHMHACANLCTSFLHFL